MSKELLGKINSISGDPFTYIQCTMGLTLTRHAFIFSGCYVRKYNPETRSMEHIFSCETREELEEHLQNYGLAEHNCQYEIVEKFTRTTVHTPKLQHTDLPYDIPDIPDDREL